MRPLPPRDARNSSPGIMASVATRRRLQGTYDPVRPDTTRSQGEQRARVGVIASEAWEGRRGRAGARIGENARLDGHDRSGLARAVTPADAGVQRR